MERIGQNNHFVECFFLDIAKKTASCMAPTEHKLFCILQTRLSWGQEQAKWGCQTKRSQARRRVLQHCRPVL